jgi:hypothetical protein
MLLNRTRNAARVVNSYFDNPYAEAFIGHVGVRNAVLGTLLRKTGIMDAPVYSFWQKIFAASSRACNRIARLDRARTIVVVFLIIDSRLSQGGYLSEALV